MRRSAFALTAALLLAGLAAPVLSKEVGRISTNWRVLGPDDAITVERYDDPKVQNVSCYVSRAVTGGVSGAVGLATDPSRFSIACRAVGPVSMPQGLPRREEVFSASASVLFKDINVHRMVDAEKNVLVYVVVSTKLINGSPFNSISAVPADRP